MKYFFLLPAACFLIFSCHSLPVAHGGISGTYIRMDSDEISKIYDTLFIKPAEGASENQYSISNSSGIMRKNNKGLFDAPYETHHSWSAVYDEKSNLLNVTDRGDTYKYDASGGLLSNGNVTFKKI
jgi:hypothetical protein